MMIYLLQGFSQNWAKAHSPRGETLPLPEGVGNMDIRSAAAMVIYLSFP